jgi:4-hydroxybenzoyl-CoA reductase subunit alpha
MDQGKILNPSLADYKVIRSLDMPDTKIIEIDTYEPEGPFGAKEAGEGLTNPTAAAIANAVRNAVGVTVTDLPITPEKILKAIKEKEKQKKSGKKEAGR